MNAVLLAWPFLPPAIIVILTPLFGLVSKNAMAGWVMVSGAGVLVYGADWWAAGALIGAGVLLVRAPARRTRRHVRVVAAGIALNTLILALLWAIRLLSWRGGP
jgi:hypothetical protein